jgi:hypothetical protein
MEEVKASWDPGEYVGEGNPWALIYFEPKF